MSVLDEIVETKRAEVAALPAGLIDECRVIARDLRPPRDFARRLWDMPAMAVIAEVKRASPSAGTIAGNVNPAATARRYDAAGAACISVLTDGPYFHGTLDDLRAVRGVTDLPVLRKDFLIDPVQVYEARAAGADCVLLIAECLPQDDLRRLYDTAGELGMHCLIELYDAANVDRVLAVDPTIVGVNNRDLRTFEVDLDHSLRLRREIPSDVIFVSESGIRTSAETRRLADAGVDAVLVGETLMRADDIHATLRELSLIDPMP